MRVDISGAGKQQVVTIEGCRLLWPHLAGNPGKFNRAGERGFTIVFDDADEVQKLVDEGYNVNIKPPREEGEEPFMKMNVKLAFTPTYRPQIWLNVNGQRKVLDENTCEAIDMLRSSNITNVVVQFHPFIYDNEYGHGKSAWLDGIEVFAIPSRFMDPDFDFEEI